MECAGNGRAYVEPRVVSQPWLLEAVGTARWRGTLVAPLVQEAGIRKGAVDVLFTGLDRGVEGGEEQAYERSLPVGASRRRRTPRVRDQRRAAPAATRVSAASRRSGLVRHDERQVALADHGARRAVRRVPDGPFVPRPSGRGRRGRADHDDRATLAHGSAGDPGVPHSCAYRRGRRVRARRPGVVGRRRGCCRRCVDRRWSDVGVSRAR